MTFEEQSVEISQGSLSSESGASPGEPNLQTYSPTPYQPEVWPVVTEAKRESSFQPLDYERVSELQYVVDPMFENFDRAVRARRQASSELLEAPDTEGHVYSAVERPTQSVLEAGEELDLQIGQSDPQMSHESGEPPPADAESHASEESRRDQTSGMAGAAEVHARKDATRGLGKAVSADIDNRIEQEVQKRLAAAQEEREQMLAQVQQTAYTKALEDARAEFEASRNEYQSRFDTIIEDVRSQASEACRDNEQQAVELAFQIAKKLLGSIVSEHREYIHDVISEALKAAGNTEITSIRVSPQDYQFLSSPEGSSDGSRAERTWKLESDDSIGAGCIVVTPAGDIDFDLDKSWARMREKVSRGPKS